MAFLIVVRGEDGRNKPWAGIQRGGHAGVGTGVLKVRAAAAGARFLVLGLANHVDVEVFRVSQVVVQLQDLGLAARGNGEFRQLTLEAGGLEQVGPATLARRPVRPYWAPSTADNPSGRAEPSWASHSE